MWPTMWPHASVPLPVTLAPLPAALPTKSEIWSNYPFHSGHCYALKRKLQIPTGA